MVIYTAEGRERMCRAFDIYELDPLNTSYVDLGFARDKAEYEESIYLDRAFTIADRLGIEPTWYRMTTPEIIERCKTAYQKWMSGKASTSDLVDAMNYCVFQADFWGDEIKNIDELVQAKEMSYNSNFV